MKALFKVLATATLLSGSSTAVLAQIDAGAAVGGSGSVSVDAGNTSVDAGVDSNTNAGASTTGGSVGAAANAAGDAALGVSGSTNYGAVISSLSTTSTTAADIEGLGADVDVEVITLSEIEGNAGEHANALDQAVSGQASTVAELRAAISSNTELRGEVEAALAAEGDFDLDDIVAVTSSGEGNLTLVVDDSDN